MKIDTDGSPISLVRIDTEKAYSDLYTLLQSYINSNDLSAWEQIKAKIDYLYSNMTLLLDTLDQETDFKSLVLCQIAEGKKLLFKVNGVGINVIDGITHGAGNAAPICSQWPFVAALMRYFHDSLNISYYQMTFGEASTSAQLFATTYSALAGRTITCESTLEGRNGNFYGGFGFYFVRKYLSDRHPSGHTDDPMNGYENSVTGEYLPPGRANDRLMLYDLNNIYSADRGRTIKVTNGGNYDELTIHKAVIGGDDTDKADYPGCILINTPILKMHAQDLITNAIKNLGIGLYPSYCLEQDNKTFKYSHYTTFKSKLPHSPWVMELDEKTMLPITDENGDYIRTKTLGFLGTQCDIVRSVREQGILILNISDAIHIVNISHNPDGLSKPIPEGLMFASLDPLALDYCCARYCNNQLPLMDGKALMKKYNWPTEFVQIVPLPYISDHNIATTTGYDSPLFRYYLFDYAEQHGVGKKQYYVTGYDTLTDTPFVSLDGHLGRIENRYFNELITNTLYYNPTTLIHHLQLTILSYAKCNDILTGTSIYNEIMNLFDENKDGVIDYEEKGRGYDNAMLAYLSKLLETGTSKKDSIKYNFLTSQYFIKYIDKDWNLQNIDFLKDFSLITIANIAYELSKSEDLSPDLFISNMSYGQGLWPSWQTAFYIWWTTTLYGGIHRDQMSLNSLYGYALQYADMISNNSQYSSHANAINDYFKDCTKTKKTLPFTLYVPKDYSMLDNIRIPNVVETDDKEKLFTVVFEEVW
ncbi:hypothetical protein lbkm_2449 [Lachnospiraceae bacterium KM106-2]|nr:hypothetical protein lbkm_2449 [Lachnospiraceae bacterium KM106-2]